MVNDGSNLFISNRDFISNPDSDIHDYLQYHYADGTAESRIVSISQDPSDASKTPIILIHGIDPEHVPGEMLTDGWYDFVRFFNASPELAGKYHLYIVGYESNVVSVEQLGEDFASVLNKLDASSNGFRQKKFIVIAHSMGGLVSRVMMNQTQSDGTTKWGGRVIKLITLATPHHGTPVADDSGNGPLGSALVVNPTILALANSPSLVFWRELPFYNAFNRSDLRWDNYNPSLQGSASWAAFPDKNNLWLKDLNAPANPGRAYDANILAYAGIIGPSGHGFIYNSLEEIIAAAINLGSDGVVPTESAHFDQHSLAGVRTEPDYDHTQMWRGHNYNLGPNVDNSAEPLFLSIKEDLLNNVPTSTTGQQTIKPSSFTISATAKTLNGTPAITIRIETPSDPGVTYAVYSDGIIFNLSGLELTDTTVVQGVTYHYFVRATNSAGLYTDSKTVTVIAPNPSAPPNTIAPAVPIGLTVNPSSWSRLNQFFVSWTNPTHPSNIVKVWYWIGNAPPGPGQGTSQPLPQGNPLLVTLPLQQGSSNLYVWLQDDQGNVNRLNYATAALKLDPNPPSIAPSISPVSTSVSNTISISGNALDDLSGVASVTWANDLSGGNGSAAVVKSGDGLSATWSVPSVQLASGVNHITFTATDNAGNVGHSTVIVNYYDGSTNASGSVQVTISPPGVNSLGAQWRFAGEVLWHNSGDVVNSSSGNRSINFAPVDGWTPPTDKDVMINAAQPTALAVNYTVSVSSQPPYQPSLPYPPNDAGNVARNALTVSWLGGSPSGTVTYALALGTSPNVSISASPLVAAAGYGSTSGSSYAVPATLQPATTYFWRVYTKDHNGLVTIGPVWSFTTEYAIPDLVPSNLTIDGNIQPGATVSAHVTVTNRGSFTAQGADVNLYLSRTPGAKEALLAPVASPPLSLPTALAPGQSGTLSCQVVLNNLPTGQSFLDAWIDSAPWGANAESDYNNNTTSLSLTYIDGTPPTVSYFAPQNVFTKTGAALTLIVQGSDDDSIKTLDFYYSVDGGITWTPIQEGYALTTSPASGIPYSWTVPTTLPVGGNLLLRVVATDPSGNSGERITGPYVIHDGTAPTVRIISPNGGETLAIGGTTTVQWAASAPNGVSRMSLYVNYYDNANSTTFVANLTNNTSGNYAWTVPAITTTAAKLRITLTDVNGGTAEDWSDDFFALRDTSAPPPAPWTTPLRVTVAPAGSNKDNQSPHIAVDDAGNVHLVYLYTDNGDGLTFPRPVTQTIYYQKLTGTTWSAPMPVYSVTQTEDVNRTNFYLLMGLNIAADHLGNPHVVWNTYYDQYHDPTQANQNDIYYSTLNGGAWTAPFDLSQSVVGPDGRGTSSVTPCIQIDSLNQVHVVWTDGYSVNADGLRTGVSKIFYRRKNGRGWGDVSAVTSGQGLKPSLGVDGMDNLHLAFVSFDGAKDYPAYSKWNGASWSPPVRIGDQLNTSCQIAVDQNNNPHVVWTAADSSNPPLLEYASYDGTNWLSSESLSASLTGGPDSPRIAMDSLGRPHLTWESNDASLRYDTKFQTQWLVPTRLNLNSQSVFQTSSDLAISNANQLHVVWSAIDNGHFEIFYNHADVGATADISPPLVTVAAPSGGEAFSIGSPINIGWTAIDNVGVTSVDFDYSTDNGLTWNSIASNQTNSGSFAWTVPNAAVMQIRVTAHDAAGNAGVGFSSNFYASDLTPPAITVTAPSASANLTAGSTIAIQWAATDNVGVSKIDLEYSINNGLSWLAIASALSNTGNYSWTVPNTVTTGLLIRVTAHDNSGFAAPALSQTTSITAGNTPPVAPNRPFPVDAAVQVDVASPMLQWSSGDVDGDPLTYEIHLGTSSNPSVVASGIGPAYTPPTLSYQTTYHWQVIASDGKATTAGPVWTFRTGANPVPPPTISTQPAAMTVLMGKNATINVQASGTGPFTYQWRKNGKNIAGATSATLTIKKVAAADAGKYDVVITGPGGLATSNAVTLKVLANAFPPKITAQPAAVTVNEGKTAKFTVKATGTAPLDYQWQRNNANLANGGGISGATAASVAVVKVTAAKAGNYRVIITNPAGKATSVSVKLTVKP